MSRKEQLEQLLLLEPDDAFLNYALAQECISEGDDDKAFGLFEKLLNMHPGYSATYYHLGKLLERRKKTDAAKSIYNKGIEIARNNKEQHALAELQSALLELEYGD